MAKRIFTSDLSVKGIENLKKQLLNYRDNINLKLDEFVNRLVNIGIPVIKSNMDKAKVTYDSKGVQSGTSADYNTYVDIKRNGNVVTANLILEGEQVIFAEFGAGVHHNTEVGTSPHPQGQQFGFLIGTYGQGFGARQVWGYYDDSGKLVLTHGIEAQMPMHKAKVEIVKKYIEIAKQVFG